MSEPLQPPHVSADDPILADDFNAIRDLLGRDVTGEGVMSTPDGWIITHPPDRERRVLVRNASGGAVGYGGILGVSLSALDFAHGSTEGQNRLKNQYDTVLKGETPTVADHLGRWVVPVSPPLPNGAPGEAIASGTAHVRVYVTAVGDKFCDVIAKKTVGEEDCYLGTGGSGAQILWRENEGSGAETVVWAIVRLGGGGSALTLGKLNGTLAVSGYAMVSVWAWNGTSFADTNEDIKVYDWLMKTGAASLAGGKKVTCQMSGGIYILTGCECP